MKKKVLVLVSLVIPSLAACLGLTWHTAWSVEQPKIAKGVVYHDVNGNRRFDGGDKPLPNVRVSNGGDIVKTDAEGRYQLPIDDDTILFVIQPSGWRVPLTKTMLPQFYYVHKPAGSPKLKYRGIAPTGPLPASVDFPLYPQKQPKVFKALLFGDPQPRNQKEIDYITHDVVEELVGTDASFGVTLGDVMFDDLNLFEPQARAIALLGIPWYNVIGNHDINTDVNRRDLTNETFERNFGPTYYSFDYSTAHFVVLDDIDWYYQKPKPSKKNKNNPKKKSQDKNLNTSGKEAKPQAAGGEKKKDKDGKKKKDKGRYTYRGGFGKRQLQFLRNDLAMIPKDKLVVLMMHIPLNSVKDRQELYRLIEDRPFCISISGHTHWHEHKFITKKDGWKGPEPHHHIINVTVSGSWWSGAPNERGIPHTMMRDGAPNGYSIMTFDGQKYTLDYKVAGKPGDYQMNIHAPEEITVDKVGTTDVYVNVFNGSQRSKVEMRVGRTGAWRTMKRKIAFDPGYVKLVKEEKAVLKKFKKAPWRALPGPTKSSHLWQTHLPAATGVGVHLLEVRATDMHGRTFAGRRVIRVRAAATKSERP